MNQPAASDERSLFAALLKYWRSRQGFSQLDLSCIANVSSRHVSFLETGRSQPSKEMVLTLADALDLPLRNRNELLRAANLAPHYPEDPLDIALTATTRQAIDAIFRQQEPYPSIAMNAEYDVLLTNDAGASLLSFFTESPTDSLNVVELLYTADQPILDHWEPTTKEIWRRLHRESLRTPQNPKLLNLIDTIVSSPLVEDSWLAAALHVSSEPATSITFLLPGNQKLSFLSTITVFNAPQNVAIEELRIENFYPLDQHTVDGCERHLRSNISSGESG